VRGGFRWGEAEFQEEGNHCIGGGVSCGLQLE
jgi:hypothetical protein